MTNETIRQFLEQLIVEKQFKDLSPALKETMIESLHKRLEAHIIMAIAEKLDEKTAEEMNAMLEGDAPKSVGELQEFLKSRIPNIEEAIAEAMMEFRSVYLAN
ncbi:hypothetical protein EPO05_05345 [Patescibacteria group bacterium]|nr:MAG: hypothetical protein EPO05_05345 [Patescibacteria group bacterium]